MGKQFGNLIRAKNIITYTLSPYEQRLFPGFFSRGIPNTIRRFSEEAPYMFPGLFTAYLIYYFGTKNYEKRLRKNPADYEHEE